MSNNTQNTPISYELFGYDLQMLELQLQPGQTVVAEKGAMAYMDQGINFEAKISDGSAKDKGFFNTVASGIKRKLSGEDLFMVHLTNASNEEKAVGIGAPYAGQILPLRIRPGDELICQRDAFLAASKGIEISFTVLDSPSGALFGGEGIAMQVIRGDGMVFIHGGGSIIEKKIEDDELLIDTGSLIGFTDGIDFSARPVGRAMEMLFGGEGVFLSKLSGTGSVWIQTLPFKRQSKTLFEGMQGMFTDMLKEKR